MAEINIYYIYIILLYIILLYYYIIIYYYYFFYYHPDSNLEFRLEIIQKYVFYGFLSVQRASIFNCGEGGLSVLHKSVSFGSFGRFFGGKYSEIFSYEFLNVTAACIFNCGEGGLSVLHQSVSCISPNY